MSPAERPLSPHLQVYRPMYTMVLSILHRATGLLLSACSLLLVVWFVSIAAGPSAYAGASRLFSSFAVRLLLTAALAAFCFHFFAGIRHLGWDAGVGFEKRASRLSGAVVVLCGAAAFAAAMCLSPAGRWLMGAP